MTYTTDTTVAIGELSYHDIRKRLLEKQEIAILDVREEAPFAEGHPLFAANLPLSRLETDVYNRLPNRQVSIVVYDDDEGLATIAAERLVKLGYQNVSLLQGGLNGWEVAGGEIFIDVNSPSKAFGELVEAKRHTPSLSAQEVKKLIDDGEDIVILDARRFDEYNTMSIPTSTSVPGAELVLRVKEVAPDPSTRVIVNCAGRTRSIIGTQSLVNAGIENPVFALRNGTIGWILAGQSLQHGQTRKAGASSKKNKKEAVEASREVADNVGVKRINRGLLQHMARHDNRTTYFFDVRSPEEYLAGRLPGFLSAPGGQLVQETDHFAPVRGSRIVLFDNEEVRANMTASWLAQMNWDVYVIDHINITELNERGPAPLNIPELPELSADTLVSPGSLQYWFNEKKSVQVIDLATAAIYSKRHIPRAWYALRSQLAEALQAIPVADNYVLTSPDGVQAHFVFTELAELTKARVYVLDGGTEAWIANGLPVDDINASANFASPQIDRYPRPYEGINNTPETMQAYLDWEYGLVEQLARDGSHGFVVL